MPHAARWASLQPRTRERAEALGYAGVVDKPTPATASIELLPWQEERLSTYPDDPDWHLVVEGTVEFERPLDEERFRQALRNVSLRHPYCSSGSFAMARDGRRKPFQKDRSTWTSKPGIAQPFRPNGDGRWGGVGCRRLDMNRTMPSGSGPAADRGLRVTNGRWRSITWSADGATVRLLWEDLLAYYQRGDVPDRAFVSRSEQAIQVVQDIMRGSGLDEHLALLEASRSG